ncbi:MAG: NADH-quinone oxidoreductase subunit J [Chloroflexota bacterium]
MSTFVQSAVFWVAAVSSVIGGIGVISARNPVYSALSLILTLAQLAIMYVLLNAQFIAAAQILIYAGAVMVLFLFVITLLGVSNYRVVTEDLPGQRPAAVILGGLLLVGVIFFVAQSPDAITGGHGNFNALLAQDNVKAFGAALFTQFVFPFEATALLLIVAMVGAVALGRRHNREFDAVLGRIERQPTASPPTPPDVASVPVERSREPSEV